MFHVQVCALRLLFFSLFYEWTRTSQLPVVARARHRPTTQTDGVIIYSVCPVYALYPIEPTDIRLAWLGRFSIRWARVAVK
jgi:hypothetical protein